MTTHQPPKRLIIALPKRYCANPDCKREIAVTSKYATCSWRCKLAVDAELEAIEAADKLQEEYPF